MQRLMIALERRGQAAGVAEGSTGRAGSGWRGTVAEADVKDVAVLHGVYQRLSVLLDQLLHRRPLRTTPRHHHHPSWLSTLRPAIGLRPPVPMHLDQDTHLHLLQHQPLAVDLGGVGVLQEPARIGISYGLQPADVQGR